MPKNIDYNEDRQTDMDCLMRGWLKTKEFVSSNLKTSSSTGEEGKVSIGSPFYNIQSIVFS